MKWQEFQYTSQNQYINTWQRITYKMRIEADKGDYEHEQKVQKISLQAKQCARLIIRQDLASWQDLQY